MLADAGTLLATMLSWAPTIAIAFLGGLAIGQIVETALTAAHSRSRWLAIGLGFGGALLAGYGLPAGSAILEYFASVARGTAAAQSPFWQLMWAMGGVLFRLTDISRVSDTIYAILLAVAVVFYVWMGIGSGLRTVRWQQRLAGTPADSSIEVRDAARGDLRGRDLYRHHHGGWHQAAQRAGKPEGDRHALNPASALTHSPGDELGRRADPHRNILWGARYRGQRIDGL